MPSQGFELGFELGIELGNRARNRARNYDGEKTFIKKTLLLSVILHLKLI